MVTVHAIADDTVWKSCLQPRIEGDMGLAIRLERQVKIVARAHQIVAPHVLDRIRPVRGERASVRAVMPPEGSPHPVVDLLSRQMGSGEHCIVALLEWPVVTENVPYESCETIVGHRIGGGLRVPHDIVEFVETDDV